MSAAITIPRHSIEAAIAVMRAHGLAFSAPWEGDLDDVERERFDALTQAIQTAIGGNVLAPPEPTREMAKAGRKALCAIADRMETAKLTATSTIDFWQQIGHQPANEIYKAMLASAPSITTKASA